MRCLNETFGFVQGACPCLSPTLVYHKNDLCILCMFFSDHFNLAKIFHIQLQFFLAAQDGKD